MFFNFYKFNEFVYNQLTGRHYISTKQKTDSRTLVFAFYIMRVHCQENFADQMIGSSKHGSDAFTIKFLRTQNSYTTERTFDPITNKISFHFVVYAIFNKSNLIKLRKRGSHTVLNSYWLIAKTDLAIERKTIFFF